MTEEEQKKYFVSPSVKELDTSRIPIYDFGKSLNSEYEWHFFKDPEGTVANRIVYNVGAPTDPETAVGQIDINLTENPPIAISAVSFYMRTTGDVFDDAEITKAYNALTLYFVGVITCNNNPHASLGLDTGCKLLLHYDADNNGVINLDEFNHSYSDYQSGIITEEEHSFVSKAYIVYEDDVWTGRINVICPGCWKSKIVTFSSIPENAEVSIID